MRPAASAGFHSTVRKSGITAVWGLQFSYQLFYGRPPMPVYDYVCLDCHKPFETVLTLNEHDKETPKCPHCGSKNVEQEAAAFFAVTSRKS
jgi:putative FmdB family regulatory protein